MMKDDDVQKAMIACSDDIRGFGKEMLGKHDVRFIYACFLAESAYCGAMIREAKVYPMDIMVSMFAEAMATAVTMRVEPKVMYMDGDVEMGSKQ